MHSQVRAASSIGITRVVWLLTFSLVPADMYCVFADIHLCVAGELPKELGNLVNLKELMLQFNGFTGTIVCPVLHATYLD